MRNETNLRESQDLLNRLCEHQEAIVVAEQTLRQQCQEMGRWLKDLKQKYQSGHGHCLAELEVLRMGNDCLQQLIAERDQQLGELNQRLAAAPPEQLQDETHLAELQDLREQLAEKEAIIEQMRARNAELNDAGREAELQLSRERAQLARERVQLDRLREEIRQQLECIQREAGVR